LSQPHRDQSILQMRAGGFSLAQIGHVHGGLSAARVRTILLEQTRERAKLLPPDQRSIVLNHAGRTLPFNVRYLLKITKGVAAARGVVR
jgi:hypothetical protein